MSNNFHGPFFIIGMPRSGTKLLRGLLLEHPMIGVPVIETEFLPYWVKYWQGFRDLSKRQNFKKFYEHMLNLPYFIFMQEMGKLIDEEIWFQLCKDFTPTGVFEALIRHDAGVNYGSDKIWGDKSPSYICHLPLLKNLFPKARFIHIIRDVRDYCLSIHQAWGKNMIRAAQRWAEDVQKCKDDSNKFSEDYIELRFEDLLDKPEDELRQICAFLGLEFDINMLNLSKPTENIAVAKGKKEIIKNNKEKYLKLMKLSLRHRIESIAVASLQSCGYPVSYPGKSIRISKLRMLYYELLDGVHLVHQGIKGRGFRQGTKFIWKYFRISANRYA